MSTMAQLGRVGIIGVELVSSIAVGYFAGRMIDVRVGGHGWVTWGGLLLGVAAGFHLLYRTARTLTREAEAEAEAEAAEEAQNTDEQQQP